jgi:hypothetical protein
MASLSSATKRIIALTPADLDVENTVLSDFITFARHVIEQSDPAKAAKYAGILYLALISAFEAAAMLEYEWAPALTLEIQSIEFEVRCLCLPDADAADPVESRSRRTK